MGRKTRTLVSRSKKALISAPVLKLPDPSLPYEVIADASVNGLGAVLVQQGHAIAYYSQKFTNAEKITTSEQELLAQHDALLQWRCYLEGPQDGLSSPNRVSTTNGNIGLEEAMLQNHSQDKPSNH